MMKKQIKRGLLAAMAFTSLGLNAQTSEKKTQSFTIEQNIPAPVDKIWAVVADDFANIQNSHPQLVSSHYVEGSPASGEGCERVCVLSENGKKYTKEKIVDFQPLTHSFIAEIEHIEGLPLDASASYMRYEVMKIDDSNSKLILTMVYRTKPAFLGALAKGKFKNTIQDYAIGIWHHVLTDEIVGPNNFKTIKKKFYNS